MLFLHVSSRGLRLENLRQTVGVDGIHAVQRLRPERGDLLQAGTWSKLSRVSVNLYKHRSEVGAK